MTWRHELVGVSVMFVLASLGTTGCGADSGPVPATTRSLAGDLAGDSASPSVATAATPGTSRKTLYLANPYGFSPQQRDGPLQELAATLESMGAEVWEPFAPQR